MKRSFDRLAKQYSFWETIAFGKLLQNARTSCLDHIGAPEQALLIGDGDGRFAAELLSRFPSVKVDSIDNSSAMLDVASERIQKLDIDSPERYRQHHADALAYNYAESNYDFIATQFALDCFPSVEASQLVDRLSRSLRLDGMFHYADFRIPRRGFVRFAAERRIAVLYWIFRWLTDIKAKRLPAIIWPSELRLERRRLWRSGSIVSELRRKTIPQIQAPNKFAQQTSRRG